MPLEAFTLVTIQLGQQLTNLGCASYRRIGDRRIGCSGGKWQCHGSPELVTRVSATLVKFWRNIENLRQSQHAILYVKICEFRLNLMDVSLPRVTSSGEP